MFETALLVTQLLMVLTIAAWLATGVWDNIVHPSNNELFTAQVMQMDRMREAYPDEYARVAHRAITSRALQRFAFRIVVLAELAAALVLWAGAVLLLLHVIGSVQLELAKSVALIGAALFTCVWGGFLVVGNYFCYWFCHEGAQNTHYQMTLWGLLTCILLAQSA